MLCGIFSCVIMRILSKSHRKINMCITYIHCAIGRPVEAHTAHTWSYCTHDRSASKRSVCLAEWYNSLVWKEPERSNIYRLLVSIFSVNHL